MMNLILVAYYYPPPHGAGTGRPHFMARYLRDRGHAVTVITSSCRDDVHESGVLGIHDPSSNRCRGGVRSVSWLTRRLLVEAANSLGNPCSILSAWKSRAGRVGRVLVKAEPPDLLLATYPPVENLAVGMTLARRAGCPLVADFRDGLTYEPVEGVLPVRFPAIRRAYARMEAKVLNRAAGVLAAHPSLADNLADKVKDTPVLWLPNGYEPIMKVPPSPLAEMEGFHLVHTGRFSLSDRGCDPKPLVRALTRLPGDFSPSMYLHLLGRLSRAEMRLFRPLERRGRVVMHGEVSREASRAWQVHADGLLLVVSSLRPSVIPGKLLEYLPMRAPVLAVAPPGAAGDILTACGRGLIADPRDPAALDAALRRLAGGGGDASRRNEKEISRYEWSELGAGLETFLREVQAKKKECV